MPEEQFNRHFLFLTATNILKNNKFFQNTDDIRNIRNIYQGSYLIINGFENLLTRKEIDINSEMFMAQLDDNEDDAKNYIDVGYIREKVLSKKLKSNKDRLLSLIIALHDLQEMVLNEYTAIIKKIVLANEDYLHSLPQVFLSYAYLDKGLSFALFLYFLSHNIFLYVDWMWNKLHKKGWEIKKVLNSELKMSQQLLFTLTPASELNAQGYHTVRQWCAWEIGNFYAKKEKMKFFVNFYPNHTHNMFLDSIKPMKGIKDQKIY